DKPRQGRKTDNARRTMAANIGPQRPRKLHARCPAACRWQPAPLVRSPKSALTIPPVSRVRTGVTPLAMLTLHFSAAGEIVSQQEIDAVRALLTSKPRPVGWRERRQRIDEIGSTWPDADDVRLEEVKFDGVPGEWSIVPGSDPSHVLLFFHGGGFCS